MKIKFRVLAAALIVSATISPAMAEDGTFYGAFYLGQGNAKDACSGLPSTLSCTPQTNAIRFGLGYQANQYMAVEAAYLKSAPINIGGSYSGVPINGEYSMSGSQLSAIGSFPLNNSAAILAKVGIGSFKAASSMSSTIDAYGGVSTTPTSSSQTNTNVTLTLPLYSASLNAFIMLHPSTVQQTSFSQTALG